MVVPGAGLQWLGVQVGGGKGGGEGWCPGDEGAAASRCRTSDAVKDAWQVLGTVQEGREAVLVSPGPAGDRSSLLPCPLLPMCC